MAALVLPSAADAWTMPGERPGDERLFAQVDVALAYWTARGVVGCPSGVRASFSQNLSTEDGTGYAAGHGYECEVWIHSGMAYLARLPGPRSWRVNDAGLECAIVVHEVGHALGLPHAETGIMRADIAGRSKLVPMECWTWAGDWFPRPRRPTHLRVAFGAMR